MADDEIDIGEDADIFIEEPREDDRPMLAQLPWKKYDYTVPQGTPRAKCIAGGRIDAPVLGRIIESYRQWLLYRGRPVGAWRITLEALYQLEREDTEALYRFVRAHWGRMRVERVSPAMANRWYKVALIEWNASVASFTD